MIPLRDNVPSRTVPGVNFSMIALCTVAFLAQVSGGEESTMIERYGMIPARVGHPDKEIEIPDVKLERTRTGGVRQVIIKRPAAPAAVPPWLTMLTCVFLHGGWMHFLGNMWFLFIFGDNVEDRFGHGLFTLFYLGSGVAASLAHYVADPASPIPTIGASGAIAGVMGAYFVFYPRAHVMALVPMGAFSRIAELPAPLFLGIWFLIQLASGAMGGGGGVAWWAHIGGFVVGAAGALLMNLMHVARPPVVERMPNDGSVRFRSSRRPPEWP